MCSRLLTRADGLPFVELSYRVRVRLEPVTVLYQLESASASKSFVSIAKGLVEAQVAKYMCKSCHVAFQSPEGLLQCAKCKSSYVVQLNANGDEIDSTKQVERETVAEVDALMDVAVAVNKREEEEADRANDASEAVVEEMVVDPAVIAGLASLTELDKAEVDLSAETIGNNMELYFRLKFFSDDEHETFLYLLRSSYVPFGSDLSNERYPSSALSLSLELFSTLFMSPVL